MYNVISYVYYNIRDEAGTRIRSGLNLMLLTTLIRNRVRMEDQFRDLIKKYVRLDSETPLFNMLKPIGCIAKYTIRISDTSKINLLFE